MQAEFAALSADVLLISADPPAASREFRRNLGLTMPLISDEENETADYYGIPVRYQSPRARVYPNGYVQPAAFIFVGNRETFRFIQRPGFFNAGGAFGRPGPKKLLRRLRRGLRS